MTPIILITGGAGFLGSHPHDRFIANDHDLHATSHSKEKFTRHNRRLARDH